MKKAKIIVLNLVIILYLVLIAGYIFDNDALLIFGLISFSVVLICFLVLAMMKEKKPAEEAALPEASTEEYVAGQENTVPAQIPQVMDYTQPIITNDTANANMKETQPAAEGYYAPVAENTEVVPTVDVSSYESRIADLEDELMSARETMQQQRQEIERLKSIPQEPVEKNEKAMPSILPGTLTPREQLATINIVDIAKSVAQELREAALRAGLRVQVSAGEDQILVRADEGLLRVLFRNIVDNSIKYMNRQGMLVITLSTIGDDLFVVLKDNGEGLAIEETNHIFELNYQGSNRISGNGLGLAQAKAVVEYYGGNIYAKSNPGGGMGIYIQLPTS